jgi:hypothetical protein
MHVLVRQRQAEKVERVVAGPSPPQQVQRFVELPRQLVARLEW